MSSNYNGFINPGEKIKVWAYWLSHNTSYEDQFLICTAKSSIFWDEETGDDLITVEIDAVGNILSGQLVDVRFSDGDAQRWEFEDGACSEILIN